MKQICLTLAVILPVTGCEYVGSRGPKSITYTYVEYNQDQTTNTLQLLKYNGQESWLRENAVIVQYADERSTSTMTIGENGAESGSFLRGLVTGVVTIVSYFKLKSLGGGT